MPTRKRPRKGSLQYYPRKRARRIYPKIRTDKMAEGIKDVKPLMIAGYKAGMTQIQIMKNNKLESKAVTVLEIPKLIVCGIRFYEKNFDGLKPVGEEWINPPKDLEVERKTKVKEIKFDFEKNKERIHDIRLIVCTQPKSTGMKKKKPEMFEVSLSGDDVVKKYEYAKGLLGKEIKPEDVFRPGEYCDVTAITKGHGYTGAVKRFGIKIQGRKDEQHHRHPGSIGSTVPRKVDWRVPMPGQYGFFQRTEYNKKIVMIEKDGSKVNPDGGFVNYGLVKGPFILVEGSVPGPKKRLIFLRKPLRNKKYEPVEVKGILRISQQ